MHRVRWSKTGMKHNVRIAMAVVLAFVVTWFCIVSTNATQHAGTSSSIGSCANCHTDGQTPVLLKFEDERREIEPTPPPVWQRSNPPLTSYYIGIPVIFLGYLITRSKIHLTTQMRF